MTKESGIILYGIGFDHQEQEIVETSFPAGKFRMFGRPSPISRQVRRCHAVWNAVS